ncbi:MAG: hypothetical protein AAGG01_15105, partial [Planctomycetota bacterium]
EAGERTLASGTTGLQGDFLVPFQPASYLGVGASQAWGSSIGQNPRDTLRATIKVDSGSPPLAEVSIPNLPAGTTDVRWTLPAGSISGRISGARDEVIALMARGVEIDLVPKGEDMTARRPERCLRLWNLSGFTLEHLAAGSYTLVAWRRAPPATVSGPAWWTDQLPAVSPELIRYEPAIEPLPVTLGRGERLEGIVLSRLP